MAKPNHAVVVVQLCGGGKCELPFAGLGSFRLIVDEHCLNEQRTLPVFQHEISGFLAEP